MICPKPKSLIIPMITLSLPTSVHASSCHVPLNSSALISFNAIVQSGAVVNNASNNNNINIIIVGMVVIIIILVGTAMFAPKK